MLNTSSSEPMPLHRFEVESNGRTVESQGGRYTNIIYDNPNTLPLPPHSEKSDSKKDRRVNKRVLYGLLGVIGIIAIAIPIIVVMLLRESDGKLKINTKPKWPSFYVTNDKHPSSVCLLTSGPRGYETVFMVSSTYT